VRRLLSERIVVVPTQSSDRRSCNGSDDRAASTDDRRHDGSQPLASNSAILRLRGCQVQPFFWLFAGSPGDRGGSRLPASLGRAWLVVVAHQSGVVRLALLLRRDAGPARGVRSHHQRQGAEETAGSAQRRGDRPLPAGGAGAAQPGGSDHSLWRGAAGVRGGRPQGWRHRQQSHGHSGRARQGRQGPLRHAVAPAPAHPSRLLAIG